MSVLTPVIGLTGIMSLITADHSNFIKGSGCLPEDWANGGDILLKCAMLLLNSLADRGYKARTNSASVIPAIQTSTYAPNPAFPTYIKEAFSSCARFSHVIPVANCRYSSCCWLQLHLLPALSALSPEVRESEASFKR